MSSLSMDGRAVWHMVVYGACHLCANVMALSPIPMHFCNRFVRSMVAVRVDDRIPYSLTHYCIWVPLVLVSGIPYLQLACWTWHAFILGTEVCWQSQTDVSLLHRIGGVHL